MNKWITFFILIGTIQIAVAQTKSKKVELGATLFTSSTFPGFNNSTLSTNRNLQIQYLNGIFLRVNFKSIAIRSILQYHKQSSISIPEPNCADCQTKEEHSVEYKIGMGAQFNILPNEDWFYSFADISYRNLNQNGVYTGGFSGEPLYFQKTFKGIETFTGVGFKIGLWHRIFFSPELGINIFNGNFVLTQSSTTGRYAPIKAHELNVNPLVRLHFTVGF